MSVIIDSYSESNQDDTAFIQSGGGYGKGLGQSFTCSSAANLTSCKFYAYKLNSPTGNATAKLYAHSGTYGTSSVAGSLLATSDNFDVSTLGASFGLAEFTFSGANQYAMAASTYYVIAVTMATAPSFPDAIFIGVDRSSPTHGGNFCYDGDANETPDTAQSGTDACFYVYGNLITDTSQFLTMF